jgi:hypothetical protein
MVGTPTVTPAYGRDYKSAKAAKADWDANLDFVYHDISSRWNGMMCSKQELEGSVKLRYARNTRVIVVEGSKNVK